MQFPEVGSAPVELTALSGACGPISVWMVLERHGIRSSAAEIIHRCRYTDEFGCFAVCMTAAFGEFGLSASLCTDFDDCPKEIEQSCYPKIQVQSAVSVEELLKAIHGGSSVIVSYLEDGDDGHFSPLSGLDNGELVLPYSKRGRIAVPEFERRWQADEIRRQAIVVA